MKLEDDKAGSQVGRNYCYKPWSQVSKNLEISNLGNPLLYTTLNTNSCVRDVKICLHVSSEALEMCKTLSLEKLLQTIYDSSVLFLVSLSDFQLLEEGRCY